MLQEDEPDEFANLILTFISRNRIGPKGVEVGIYLLLLKSTIYGSMQHDNSGPWIETKTLQCQTKFNVLSDVQKLLTDPI